MDLKAPILTSDAHHPPIVSGRDMRALEHRSTRVFQAYAAHTSAGLSCVYGELCLQKTNHSDKLRDCGTQPV